MFFNPMIITREFAKILIIFESTTDKIDDGMRIDDLNQFYLQNAVDTNLRQQIFDKKPNEYANQCIKVYLPEKIGDNIKFNRHKSYGYDLFIEIPISKEFFLELYWIREYRFTFFESKEIYKLIMTGFYIEMNNKLILERMIYWLEVNPLYKVYIDNSIGCDSLKKKLLMNNNTEGIFWNAYIFFMNNKNILGFLYTDYDFVCEKIIFPSDAADFPEFFSKKAFEWFLNVEIFAKIANENFKFEVVQNKEKHFNEDTKNYKIIRTLVTNFNLCFLFFTLELDFDYIIQNYDKINLFFHKIPQKVILKINFDYSNEYDILKDGINHLYQTYIFSHDNTDSILFNPDFILRLDNLNCIGTHKVKFLFHTENCDFIINGRINEELKKNISGNPLLSNNDFQKILDSLKNDDSIGIINKYFSKHDININKIFKKIRIDKITGRCKLRKIGVFSIIDQLFYDGDINKIVMIGVELLDSSILFNLPIQKMSIKNSFKSVNAPKFNFLNCRIWDLKIIECNIQLHLSIKNEIYNLYLSSKQYLDNDEKYFQNFIDEKEEKKEEIDNLSSKQNFQNIVEEKKEFSETFQKLFTRNFNVINFEDSNFDIFFLDVLRIKSKNFNSRLNRFQFFRYKLSYKLIIYESIIYQIANFDLPFHIILKNCIFAKDGLNIKLINDVGSLKISKCVGILKFDDFFVHEFIEECEMEIKIKILGKKYQIIINNKGVESKIIFRRII